MKKILFILLIFLIPQAQAFEDYLILSDAPVSSISWSDDEVISAVPVLTIDNKKNTIILKAKKEGKAVLTIETDMGNKLIDVEVLQDKTVVEDVEGFTSFKLDRVENGSVSDGPKYNKFDRYWQRG